MLVAESWTVDEFGLVGQEWTARTGTENELWTGLSLEGGIVDHESRCLMEQAAVDFGNQMLSLWTRPDFTGG